MHKPSAQLFVIIRIISIAINTLVYAKKLFGSSFFLVEREQHSGNFTSSFISKMISNDRVCVSSLNYYKQPAHIGRGINGTRDREGERGRDGWRVRGRERESERMKVNTHAHSQKMLN